jgi:hypothetical protein
MDKKLEQREPTIMTLVELMHKHDSADAPEVKAFIEANRDDGAFVRRAAMVIRLFNLRTVRQ